MKKHYIMLSQFSHENEVSKTHLLNTGHLTRKITENEITEAEALGLIKQTRINEYGDPVFVITDKGIQYRDN